VLSSLETKQFFSYKKRFLFGEFKCKEAGSAVQAVSPAKPCLSFPVLLNQITLLSGQCCAVSFIENAENGLNAASLSLTQEQFDAYMNGEAPVIRKDVDSSEKSVPPGLKLMYQNLNELASLHERYALT